MEDNIFITRDVFCTDRYLIHTNKFNNDFVIKNRNMDGILDFGNIKDKKIQFKSCVLKDCLVVVKAKEYQELKDIFMFENVIIISHLLLDVEVNGINHRIFDYDDIMSYNVEGISLDG